MIVKNNDSNVLVYIDSNSIPATEQLQQVNNAYFSPQRYCGESKAIGASQ